MRRRSPTREAAQFSGLSPGAALAVLVLMDTSLDAFCATAPRAVAELGGREAVRSTCRMTCVGLVPDLGEAAWEAVAEEHAEAQLGATRNLGKGVGGSGGPGPAGEPAGRVRSFGERLAEVLR